MANLSVFPNEYDSFVEHFDIQYNDLVNVSRYKTLKLKQNRTPAEDIELNNLTVTLREKLFLPDDLNKLQDSMSNMQRFVKERILKYYQYRGDWSATPIVPYSIFNSVRYSDGNIYLAYKEPGDSLPTDNTKWILLSHKGDQGERGLPGVGLVYKGTYFASTAYQENDLVSWQGNTYVCKQSNQGIYPSNTTYWDLFVSGTGENLPDLVTENKTSLVGAINETVGKVNSAQDKIDILAGSSTKEKADKEALAEHQAEEATLAQLGHVKHATLSTTLNTTWSGSSAPYSKAQTVSGILATDTPIIDVVMSGTFATDEARQEAWGNVYRAVTSANTITFYAAEKPTVSLPIQIKVVR